MKDNEIDSQALDFRRLPSERWDAVMTNVLKHARIERLKAVREMIRSVWPGRGVEADRCQTGATVAQRFI